MKLVAVLGLYGQRARQSGAITPVSDGVGLLFGLHQFPWQSAPTQQLDMHQIEMATLNSKVAASSAVG